MKAKNIFAGNIQITVCGEDNLNTTFLMLSSVLKEAVLTGCPEMTDIKAGIVVVVDPGENLDELKSLISPSAIMVFFDFMDDDEAIDEIAAACKQKGASLRNADFLEIEVLQEMKSGIKFCYCDETSYVIPYKDENEVCNAAIVMETVEAIRECGIEISEDAIKAGLKNCRIM